MIVATSLFITENFEKKMENLINFFISCHWKKKRTTIVENNVIGNKNKNYEIFEKNIYLRIQLKIIKYLKKNIIENK